MNLNLKRTGEDMAERVNKQVAKQTAMLTRQTAMLIDRAAAAKLPHNLYKPPVG